MELEEVTQSIEYRYTRELSESRLPYKMQYFLPFYLGLTQIAFILLFYLFGSYEKCDLFNTNSYNQISASNERSH